MAKKKPPLEYPENWVVSQEFYWNKRHITPGTELSIKGVRGRFRFIKHVLTPTNEWIDVVGGTKGALSFRSFRPQSIKTVHRVNKTRQNAKVS